MISNFIVYCYTPINIDKQINFSNEITTFNKISNYTFIGISSVACMFTIIFIIFNKAILRSELNKIEQISLFLHIVASLYTSILFTLFFFKSDIYNKIFTYVSLYISILELFNLFCPLIFNFITKESEREREFLLIYIAYILTAITNFVFFNFRMVNDYVQNVLNESVSNIPLLTVNSNFNNLSDDDKTKVANASSAINQYLNSNFGNFINDIDNGLNNNQQISNTTNKLVVDSIKNFVNTNIYQKLNINISNTTQTVYDQLLSNPNNDITTGIKDLLVNDISGDDPYSTSISDTFLSNSNISDSVINLVVKDINNSTPGNLNQIDNQIQTLINSIISQNINPIVTNYVNQNVLNSCENGSINLAIWDNNSLLYSSILSLIKNLTSQSQNNNSSNLMSSITDIIVNQFDPKYVTNINPLLSNNLQNTLNNLFEEQMTPINNSPANITGTIVNIILNLINSGRTTNNFIQKSMQNVQDQILTGSQDMKSAIENGLAKIVNSSSASYSDAVNEYLQQKYNYTDTKSYIVGQINSFFTPYNTFPLAYASSSTTISPQILNMICKHDLNDKPILTGIYNYVLSTLGSPSMPFDFYSFILDYYKNTISTDPNVDFKQALLNTFLYSYQSGVSSYNLKKQILGLINPTNIENLSRLPDQMQNIYIDNLQANLELKVQANNSITLKNKIISISNFNMSSSPSTITFAPSTVISIAGLRLVFTNSALSNCYIENQNAGFNTNMSDSMGAGVSCTSYVNTIYTYNIAGEKTGWIYGFLWSMPLIFKFYKIITDKNTQNMFGIDYKLKNKWNYNNFTFLSPIGSIGASVRYTDGFLAVLTNLFAIILTKTTCCFITKNNGIQQLVVNNGKASFVKAPVSVNTNNNSVTWISPEDNNISVQLYNNGMIYILNRATQSSTLTSLVLSSNTQTTTETWDKDYINANTNMFQGLYVDGDAKWTTAMNNFFITGLIDNAKNPTPGGYNVDITALLGHNFLDTGLTKPGITVSKKVVSNYVMDSMPSFYVNLGIGYIQLI